jgi:hypothetical protein
MSSYYVYGLIRPDRGQIFYVGMGMGKRAWDHQRFRKRGKSYKDNVICNMIDDLGFPEIPVVMLQTGLTRKQAFGIERDWISKLGRHPEGPLTNIHPGGQGWVELSDDAKARISKAASINKKGKSLGFKGRKDPRSPDGIASFKEKMAGRQWFTDGLAQGKFKLGEQPAGWTPGRLAFSPEHKAKMRATKRGKPLTEDHKRKIGDTHRGQKRAHFDSSWWSSTEGQAHAHKIWITDGLEETRILPSDPIPTGWMRGRMIKGRPAHNKGKPMSEEAKRHLSEVNKGKTPSEETRQKISLAGKGRVLSAETRKKISLGHKARHLPLGVH